MKPSRWLNHAILARPLVIVLALALHAAPALAKKKAPTARQPSAKSLAALNVVAVASQNTPTHVLRAVIATEEAFRSLHVERIKKGQDDGDADTVEAGQRVKFFGDETVAVEEPVWRKRVLYVTVYRVQESRPYVCSVEAGEKTLGLSRCARLVRSIGEVLGRVHSWAGMRGGIFSPQRELTTSGGKVRLVETTTKDDGKSWQTVTLEGTYVTKGHGALRITLSKPYNGKTAIEVKLADNGDLKLEGIGDFRDASRVSD